MKTGDSMVLMQPIRDALATIPAGTFGIVQFADRGVATVQFVGHSVRHNIPVGWLEAAAAVPPAIEVEEKERDTMKRPDWQLRRDRLQSLMQDGVTLHNARIAVRQSEWLDAEHQQMIHQFLDSEIHWAQQQRQQEHAE
jgi:hypothetical protein